MKYIIAILRMLAFAVICILVIIPQSLILAITKKRFAYILPHFWHKAVCIIFGVKVKLSGKIYTENQTIYIGNHISYLDIPAIASVLTYGSFVAKKDVSSWPVFGFLATLQQTAFISRSAKDAKKESNNIDSMLAAGKNLIIFPEGTSTDGTVVKPFKSSLFQIALTDQRKDLYIQPFSVKVLTTNGVAPTTQEQRDIYSWHLNMDTELHAHLWNFACNKETVLNLTFHEPIKASDHNDRKTLAKLCHEAVSNGV
ncbi:MAG: 1-acyl-sn-glycerol-3-phosphate acyltransferase [Micavibrio sp.]|nr:1-acyl-sn-glycerol-3-phosphate acyltransferase [Micavibrio sp.]|tara:strand:- start:976 stop:1740 length:765 start_codon:yes stop_codon:yes gene_type:complete